MTAKLTTSLLKKLINEELESLRNSSMTDYTVMINVDNKMFGIGIAASSDSDAKTRANEIINMLAGATSTKVMSVANTSPAAPPNKRIGSRN